MSDIAKKALEGLIIFAAFAILAITLWNIFKNARSGLTNQSDKTFEVISEIENEEFTRYQDTNVSGSEVLNLIKRYDGSNVGIIVTIATGNTSSSTCYCKGLSCSNGVAAYSDSVTLGTVPDAKDVTKTAKYINPTKQFSGEVLQDSAGNIVGLHFTLKN